MPTPLADEDWEGWIWHSYWQTRSITATIADGANAAALQTRIKVDSKAMRKWDEDQRLVGVVETVENDTAACEIQGDTRILVKNT